MRLTHGCSKFLTCLVISLIPRLSLCANDGKSGQGLGTRLASDCIGLKVKLADLDIGNARGTCCDTRQDG